MTLPLGPPQDGDLKPQPEKHHWLQWRSTEGAVGQPFGADLPPSSPLLWRPSCEPSKRGSLLPFLPHRKKSHLRRCCRPQYGGAAGWTIWGRLRRPWQPRIWGHLRRPRQPRTFQGLQHQQLRPRARPCTLPDEEALEVEAETYRAFLLRKPRMQLKLQRAEQGLPDLSVLWLCPPPPLLRPL